MKNISLIIAFIGINLLSAQKTAYVQEAKILKAISGYESAIKEIDSLSKVYKSLITVRKTDIDNKFNKIVSGYKFSQNETIEIIKSKLKSDETKKVEDLQKEFAQVQEAAKGYDEKLSAMYKEKIQPKIEKVNKTIQEYSKKNKIDMIYKLENLAPALVYVNNKIEVTDEIIKLLK